MKPDYDQIVTLLQKELPLILAHQPINLAYLYGSLAQKQVTSLSDVDIALVTSQTLSPIDRLDLELKIELRLSNLGLDKADVRVINHAPLAVQGRIVTTGVFLFGRSQASRDSFETFIRDNYQQLQPKLAQQHQHYLQAARHHLVTKGLYDH